MCNIATSNDRFDSGCEPLASLAHRGDSKFSSPRLRWSAFRRYRRKHPLRTPPSKAYLLDHTEPNQVGELRLAATSPNASPDTPPSAPPAPAVHSRPFSIQIHRTEAKACPFSAVLMVKVRTVQKENKLETSQHEINLFLHYAIHIWGIWCLVSCDFCTTTSVQRHRMSCLITYGQLFEGSHNILSFATNRHESSAVQLLWCWHQIDVGEQLTYSWYAKVFKIYVLYSGEKYFCGRKSVWKMWTKEKS